MRSTTSTDLLQQRIDEMSDIVRILCGQATFQGFEALQQDYLDQEERNLGSPRLPFAIR